MRSSRKSFMVISRTLPYNITEIQKLVSFIKKNIKLNINNRRQTTAGDYITIYVRIIIRCYGEHAAAQPILQVSGAAHASTDGIYRSSCQFR